MGWELTCSGGRQVRGLFTFTWWLDADVRRCFNFKGRSLLNFWGLVTKVDTKVNIHANIRTEIQPRITSKRMF